MGEEGFETRRQIILKDLEKEFNRPVISIIYSSTKAEVEYEHLKALTSFLKKIKDSSAVIIIDGPGGDLRTGVGMALELKKKFVNGYYTIVPQRAASSLFYVIAGSICVALETRSILVGPDPIFKYESRPLRAALCLNDPNKEIRTKAMRHLTNAVNSLFTILLWDNSILADPTKLNLDLIGKIVKTLFSTNIPSHQALTFNEVKRLKMRCVVFDLANDSSEDRKVWQLIAELYNLTQQELQVKGKTVMIESIRDTRVC